MNLEKAVLSVAAVPLLGGWMMMGGIGHTGGPAGMAGAAHMESGPVAAPLERAEATSEGLTISLSFAPSSAGELVAIEARLRADDGSAEPTDGEIRLRIEAPDGSVEEIRMQPVRSFAGTYGAQYVFPTAGLYLVTAEGRVGTGADVRTVSVTSRAEVGPETRDGRHGWIAPAIVGGLGMAALMALMMSGL
jgi:hypothetical protein